MATESKDYIDHTYDRRLAHREAQGQYRHFENSEVEDAQIAFNENELNQYLPDFLCGDREDIEFAELVRLIDVYQNRVHMAKNTRFPSPSTSLMVAAGIHDIGVWVLDQVEPEITDMVLERLQEPKVDTSDEDRGDHERDQRIDDELTGDQ